MTTPYRKVFGVTCLVLIALSISQAKVRTISPALQELLEGAPSQFADQFHPRHPVPCAVTKQPGHYSVADWKAAVDSTWGPGLPWSDKRDIFETFRDAINASQVCFRAEDTLIWDSVCESYYSEILDTVSRGRFSAIMSHAARTLQESHTEAFDSIIAYSDPQPGVPVMYFGGWGVNDHFGAGLTALADSSLLVYKAVAQHPLGLVPGDLVLGYDGIPWPDLYQELIAAELPVAKGWQWASSEASYTHSWLMAAGQNWHLYDSIDIVKYATGDTVRLATAPLAETDMSLWATEQLDVPGVHLPNPDSGEIVTWGIVEGTRIGYVYGLAWWPSAVALQWRNAIEALALDSATTGLVIDFRTNYGGWDPLAHGGLRVLFDTTVAPVNWLRRCNDTMRLDLCPGNEDFNASSTIIADPATFYDKPIAVLTGPGCVSAGDQVALAMSLHPMAKFFGKPTMAAFNDPVLLYLAPDYYIRIADDESFMPDHPELQLTHSEYPSAEEFPWVDYEEVWFTPDGVAEGRDDVVEAALAWILSRDYDQDGLVNELDNCPAIDVPGNESIETGDVDIDGSLTSGDVIWLVNYTFKSGMAPLPLAEAGDANCDSKVDAADIIYMVNHLFKSGSEPCDVCAVSEL
jgi:hypothetical protein